MPVQGIGADWSNAITEGLYGPILQQQHEARLQQMALQNFYNEQAVKQNLEQKDNEIFAQQMIPVLKNMNEYYTGQGRKEEAQNVQFALDAMNAGGIKGFETQQKLNPAKEPTPAHNQFAGVNEQGMPQAYNPNTNAMEPIASKGKIFPKTGEIASFERDLNKESTKLIKSGQLKQENVFGWKQQQRNIATGQKAAEIQAQQPLPAAEVTALSGLDVMVENLNRVSTIFKPEFTGPVHNYEAAFQEKFTGNISPEEVEFRATTRDLQDSLLRARSGAQINEQEYKRLVNFLPDPSLPSNVFQTRLDRFKKEVNSIRNSRMKLSVTPKGQLNMQQPVIENVNPEDFLSGKHKGVTK